MFGREKQPVPLDRIEVTVGPTANISQASDNVSGTIQNTTATNQNTTAVNQNTGAGTTLVDKNLPPYLVTNFIIYAGE